MARVFNGSSQYLSVASTLLTNEPIDIVAHGNADVDAGVLSLVTMGNTGDASGYYGLLFRGDVASDPIGVVKQNDGGTAGQATSIGYTINTWYIASASFISDTSRSSFIDGGTKGTSAANVSDPTPDNIVVGATIRNAVANYFDGLAAEVYVLDANMSDALHGVSGKGYSPMWSMPIKNIRAWYPLLRDDNNRVRNGYPNLSPTGSPTFGTHPAKVIYPSINGLITV